MAHETIDFNHAVAEQYPRQMSLPDKTVLTIAPVTDADRPSLAEYLESMPEEEQLFLWNDVSVIVERWCSHFDSAHTLSLLAWDASGQIVADGTLYREPGVWTTHIGKLRVFVRPDFRGRGVATEIVRELLDAARAFGLHRVVADCITGQTEMMSLLQELDFAEACRLPDFVRDRHGGLHEMVLMVHCLHK